MNTRIKISGIVLLALLMLNISCKKENTEPAKPNSPSTGHHTNDGVKDNGNGTSDVTLGGVKFNTKHRDFSGEPIVTDPKVVTATQIEEYSLAVEDAGFGVDSNFIVFSENTKIKLFDMITKSVIDEQTTSYSVTGLSVNGCIMTTEGSEEVNFYNIENGKIDRHFFHIPSLNSSKFLSICYLDYKDVFVYDENEIITFPLNKVTITPKPKAMDIPSFASIDITSDKENLYLSLGALSKPDPSDPNAPYLYYSALRIYDKNTKTSKDINSIDGITYSGITVDANYIYIAIKDANVINVINKHNQNNAGSISVDGVTKIIKEGKYLYAYSSTNQKIIKFDIVFN